MSEPPNPPDLAQAIAVMLTGRDEQTALLREIVEQSRAERSGTNITTSHLLLDIRSFWLLNHRCFIKRMSHWRRTVGFGPSSPSLPYTHTMMGIK